MEKNYYIYILASKKDGVLYTGVTNNLLIRTWQHKNKFVNGFAEKYWTTKLVYYEIFNDINEAILREKHIKAWKREWKINLIIKENPNWEDLYEKMI